jgi:hypothetical protein
VAVVLLLVSFGWGGFESGIEEEMVVQGCFFFFLLTVFSKT